MYLIRFNSDTFLWTGDGRHEDAVRVFEGEKALVIETVRKDEYGCWGGGDKMHIILLASGHVVWTVWEEFEVINKL